MAVPNRRLVGPSAVGAKKSGLRRKIMQAQRLGGYWTRKGGRMVFVVVGKPATAADRLARERDKQKKRLLGR
jgi:hypothetical protein